MTRRASTHTEEFYQIGAAHLLARDIYCGVRLAYFKEDRWPQADARWLTLTTEERQRYIDTAAELLKTFMPYPLKHPVQTVTGLHGLVGKVVGQITPDEDGAA